VWLYHRFTLSFRDIEELLAERGVIVTYGRACLCHTLSPKAARAQEVQYRALI